MCPTTSATCFPWHFFIRFRIPSQEGFLLVGVITPVAAQGRFNCFDFGLDPELLEFLELPELVDLADFLGALITGVDLTLT